MARLAVKFGKQAGQVFELLSDRNVIGRGAGCDIIIADPSVSRTHAIISGTPDGNYFIEDQGSSYGTFLNDRKLSAREPLPEKATLKFGGAVVEFSNTESSRELLEDLLPIHAPDEDSTDSFTILQILDDQKKRAPAEQESSESSEANYHEVMAANKRLSIASEISEMISNTFEMENLYKKIVEAIFATVKVDRACLLLLDETTEQIVCHAAMDDKGCELNMPFSNTIVNKVINGGESLLLANAQTQDDFETSQSIFAQNIRSAIAVPIRTREKIFGVLNADSSGTAQFNADDLKLFTLIGNQAGVAIENARLVEENVKAARLAAVGQTVASLAHCIKNILQGLKGGSYMVDEGLKMKEPMLVESGWPLVRTSQERISELVLNMLDYSKERKPSYEKADLRANMENIHALMVDRAKEKDVTVELKYSEAMPEVECDPMGVYRATLNLVTNAIDAATESKQGKVRIFVRPNDDEQFVLISVSDNGAGIPPEVMGKLFEAFHSTKDSKGTGLGLAVTKKLVDEHQGKVLIDSEVGKGTTFTLKIPVNKPQDIL